MKIVCEFEDFESMVGFAEALLKEERKTVISEPAAEEAVMTGGKEEPAETEEEEKAADPKTEEPVYTLVDVRAVLAGLQKSGKREQIKALLQSFGAARLSDIPEEKYGELMQKAGEL